MKYLLKDKKVKGEKLWVAHITSTEMKFTFLNSEWTDEKGVLGWRCSNFKEGEFYVLNNHTSRTYYQIIQNDEDEYLSAKIVNMNTVIKDLTKRESPFIKRNVSLIKFSIQKFATNSVVWFVFYESVEDKYNLLENDSYFIVSGKFKISKTKYMRNFTKKESYATKTDEVDEILLQKNDERVQIQIIFEDGSEFDTMHTCDSSNYITIA